MTAKTDKAFRLLQINERLSKGESVVKGRVLAEFGIPQRLFNVTSTVCFVKYSIV